MSCAGEEVEAEEEHAADFAGGPVLARSKGPAILLVVPGAQGIADEAKLQAGVLGMVCVGLAF